MGGGTLVEFQHPELDMKRLFCSHCGEVLFNPNSVGWRVVSQWLIAKCNDDELPPEICSDKHLFYEQRVIETSTMSFRSPPGDRWSSI